MKYSRIIVTGLLLTAATLSASGLELKGSNSRYLPQTIHVVQRSLGYEVSLYDSMSSGIGNYLPTPESFEGLPFSNGLYTRTSVHFYFPSESCKLKMDSNHFGSLNCSITGSLVGRVFTRAQTFMDEKLVKTGYSELLDDGKIDFSITQKSMTVSMSGSDYPWNYHQDIRVLNEDGSNSGGNIGHFYTADFDEALRSVTKD